MKLLPVGLLMALGIFSRPVKADEYPSTARVYKLDLTYQKIYHNSDPMVPDIQHRNWGDAVGLEVGVQTWRFYLDANPHFESAFGKVVTVGLLFHTGLQLTSWLDLEYTHHSRHSADRTNSTYDADRFDADSTRPTGYPLWDSIGIRIHFVPGTRGGR